MAGENFIKGAIKHPGAFKKQAEEAGKSTAEYAKEKEHAPGVTGERARLATTLMHLHKSKGSQSHAGMNKMNHAAGNGEAHSALAHLRQAKANRRA